jgi:hypothetical protein
MDVMDAMAVNTYRNVRIAIDEQRLAVYAILVNIVDSAVTLLASVRDSFPGFIRSWCVMGSVTIGAHSRV